MISYSLVVLMAVVSSAILIAVAYFSYVKGFDEGYESGWCNGSIYARKILDGKEK